MAVYYENQESREPSVRRFLEKYGMGSLEEARSICSESGIDVYGIVKGIQKICFEDVCWAYTAGTAAAIRSGVREAAKGAEILGQGLQSFCISGSVAEQRELGLGHGRLAAMLLSDDIKCFAFVAGHESFAAAEGAIGVIQSANKVRSRPLRVIINGLGKDAAEIISRLNGFTCVETVFDFKTDRLTIVNETAYSEGERAKVRCYGADEMREGVAVMIYEEVDISISGNATNMIRFQHPVVGTYKKYCNDHGKKFFACASGGGIGRTMNPDDVAAGPSSYGQTDLMARMYADATFAGSSSVPAHVEMMGFVGMGNNPMVGATVALAVAIEEAAKAGKF